MAASVAVRISCKKQFNTFCSTQEGICKVQRGEKKIRSNRSTSIPRDVWGRDAHQAEKRRSEEMNTLNEGRGSWYAAKSWVLLFLGIRGIRDLVSISCI